MLGLYIFFDNPSPADYIYDYYNFPQMFEEPSEYHQDQTSRAYDRERTSDIEDYLNINIKTLITNISLLIVSNGTNLFHAVHIFFKLNFIKFNFCSKTSMDG